MPTITTDPEAAVKVARTFLEMRAAKDPLATFNQRMAEYGDDINAGAAWAVEDLMHDGAEAHLARQILKALDAAVPDEDEFTVLQNWAKGLTDEALHGARFPKHSSSAAQNLAAQISTKVSAETAEILTKFVEGR